MKKLMLNSKMIHSRDRLFDFIFIPHQYFIYKKINKIKKNTFNRFLKIKISFINYNPKFRFQFQSENFEIKNKNLE
jgi:hypothetical protein